MKVARHAGADIILSEENGTFSATVTTPGGGSKSVTDKTLDGLKAKLDGLTRGRVREEALNLPAVIVTVETEWGKGYGYDKRLVFTEVEGTFKGVNAHTGDITFTRASDGKVQEAKGWWYPKDHPDLPRIRELALASVAAYEANQVARKTLDQALQVNGLQPRVDRYGSRGDNKTAAAARCEEEIVQHLRGEKPAGKEAHAKR